MYLNAGDDCIGGELFFLIAVVEVEIGVEIKLDVENVLLLNLQILLGFPNGSIEDASNLQQLPNRVTISLTTWWRKQGIAITNKHAQANTHRQTDTDRQTKTDTDRPTHTQSHTNTHTNSQYMVINFIKGSSSFILKSTNTQK